MFCSLSNIHDLKSNKKGVRSLFWYCCKIHIVRMLCTTGTKLDRKRDDYNQIFLK